MKLEIVIPALNEQQSIRSIIERCLDARERIIAESPVTEVSVTVTSDGSTDDTVPIAREYQDRINLIVFEKNRGYGAAIMAGWNASDAQLLAFLDADGTCDPLFFIKLCNALDQQQADIALGCRINPQSRMPLTRRIGNFGFAMIMSLFSLSRIKDTASGMRVVRRQCLPKLMPLPDGLHFTPAMSSRAILARDLRIIECDMPYSEREGESKLKVVRDGIRFLHVIVTNALLHRPSRPLGLIATACFLLAWIMMIYPIYNYTQTGTVLEWMIYRFIAADLLASTAILLWCGGYLGRKAVDIALSDNPARDKHLGVFGWLMTSNWFWVITAACLAIGTLLVGEALLNYLATGEVHEHWSRFIVMAFFVWIAVVLLITRSLDYSLSLLADRLQYLRNPRTTAAEPDVQRA
ncbi:glycosyltransferase family 2 protein [Mucisphaera calidilacus]|uniref:Undecaprenyl-phosphate 4-deoxy-4-formamido-L-arabinose transferase n=1 Tax=Mucisphaera calidilacus TaxID=2527982 RepID=A0A518BUB8_9BACT|nr:glycosyltransferase family 2 protein [Mucisphaera calidilacus]QDU70579.1 Undecaprenyl-phosphate 4-deoxy-4-formamido-L-arabinose transferase [Mucisphaera calidilacus]